MVSLTSTLLILRDITLAVIDILSGTTLPARSTVLIGSVSSLATKGVQSYGEDLVWGIRQLKEKLCDGLNASALPPILLNRINNPSLVRSLAEAEIWFEGLKGLDGALLKKTRGLLLMEMDRHSMGGVLAPEEHMVTLPDKIHEYNRIPTALMGWKGMGEQVMPFTQEVEEAQIMTMRDELEVNFGGTVTRNFDLRRTVEMGEAADYVLIGGGNLSEVIGKKGRNIINLTEERLRITVETVGRLERKLDGEGEDKVSIEDDMVVVIMVMDNSLYFVEDEDGGRHLPRRAEDGTYHGQLKLATGKQAAKAMEKFLPILRRLKKNRKLILVHSPRFVCKACCLDKTHCTNRKEEGFLSGMLNGIKEIRRVIRDSCHEWRVSNYKVVNVCTMLDLQEESDYSAWEEAMGEDPVHLTSQAYGKMADCIFQMAEGR